MKKKVTILNNVDLCLDYRAKWMKDLDISGL